MSVAGVSSTSFTNQGVVNSQNQRQQIQNQFQSMAQQFQSDNLATEQAGATPQFPSATGPVALPGGSAPANFSPSGWSGVQSGTHAPGRGHHRGHSCGDSDTDSESTGAPSLGQLGQAIQATNSSSAQQAYGSVQQDLQQIALNSDLITAQSAALQASSLSLTV
jgi:hypothetical protein